MNLILEVALSWTRIPSVGE